uniref:HXXEE domain-containing protein n=1 Tax=Chromera velia CCMP2878 TaxID=1169474 RepID=A0A0G4GWE0_9ALVE|mmetsp:Transcript_11852/g.22752  ORF Transcript_11852/g.22752 Transcript_11852/m.22752 type:complete len:251 (+) Transcript_11852:231-983(+)|eukprot:Cvel_23658.t1-p1 / transcript=Cvel_23658.t1 / gene=Cvel_23658 / organism=Chromera_velia_CCMP2878 / gene_product=hypothetical protein / transcript_product=hypothetical protein / location=Cvel_scaffold2463:9351-10100(-) / protein_length=250 / sequence_SO=supercontig / SO=protein_coding / is_pseudo=false
MTPVRFEDATYFDQSWMFFGPPLLLCLLLYGSRKKETGLTSEKFLAFALPFIYSLHQFEEHGYDFLGRRYAFMEEFNRNTKFGLTPRLVTLINLSFSWVGAPLCAFRSEALGNFRPSAVCWAFATFNGLLAHIGMFFLTGYRYNPGLVQSFFMVPLGFFFLWKHTAKETPMLWAFLFLLAGPIGHGIGLILPIALITQEDIGMIGFCALIASSTIGLPLFSPIVWPPPRSSDSVLVSKSQSSKKGPKKEA